MPSCVAVYLGHYVTNRIATVFALATQNTLRAFLDATNLCQSKG